LGFEKSHILGKVEVDIRSTAVGQIVFQTETPGNVLTNRFSMPIPITSGRTVLRSRLPGTMQGHFLKATGAPGVAGHWELYGVRVWARQLPDGQWGWAALPVMDTPVEYVEFRILEDPTAGGGASVGFSEFKMPVEPTPEMCVEFKLPVEPTGETFSELKVTVEPTSETFSELKVLVEATSETFSELKLPVEPTGETFGELKVLVEATADSYSPLAVPVEPTPAEYTAVPMPVPPVPNDYAELKVLVEATPDTFAEYKLPVKPTPPVPIWVEVPVDQ
jgi:hypothetical protein